MANLETVEMIVLDVPAIVREQIILDARVRKVSVNEVASRILCTAYRVKHAPTGRSYYRPGASSSRMVVRVDPRVRDKIRIKAARENVTMSGLVREALAHHYGLGVESPKRKSRWAT